jgi:2-hydroxychromene-2-carboxylate isomerase
MSPPERSARVDFYFDVVCPWAYLASTAIDAVCARAGAELRWCPILLGGLFRTTGAGDGPMPGLAPAKAAMLERDLARWAERRGVVLRKPPEHPRRTVLAMRAVLAAPERDRARAAAALYRAYWVDGVDVTEPDVVARALGEAGLDGAALVGATSLASTKDGLRAATEEAAAAGAFGVPTFVVSGPGLAKPELFWGQDRLPFVERAAARAAGREPPSEPAVAAGRAASTPALDFFFDYSSPFAYLAATQVQGIAERHGARLRWRPFLLGGLFRAIGTPMVPFAEMGSAKQSHAVADMHRWAEHWGVPFHFPTRFPMNTVTALRMTLAIEGERRPLLARAIFEAYWSGDRDIADTTVLRAVADDAGFEGERLLALAGEQSIKDGLRAETDAAVALGACGAPTMRVEPEGAGGPSWLVWGQDRLPFVEEILAGWRPPA